MRTSGGLVCSMIAFAAIGCGAAWAGEATADTASDFRVETEIYGNGTQEPVAKTLTLFRGRIAWDFIEPVSTGAGGDGPVLRPRKSCCTTPRGNGLWWSIRSATSRRRSTRSAWSG